MSRQDKFIFIVAMLWMAGGTIAYFYEGGDVVRLGHGFVIVVLLVLLCFPLFMHWLNK